MSESERRPRPKFIEKLEARREHHTERGVVYRIAFGVAGAIVLLAGLVMLVTPGPAFVLIPIGLAMLALEFVWAERLLTRALEQAEKAKQKAAETTPLQRLLSAIAIALAVAGVVVWAIWGDIPLLPV
jgi:uncharacterized protein (TIGR02611 family)